jgi:multiple sugar transport system permease protein
MTIALLLNARGRARGFLRAVFYLPSVIPVVGAVFIWRSLWDENYGLVNGLLQRLSSSLGSAWLAQHATEILVSLALWLGSGAAMVVYLAALQNIPAELEEAAILDGAGYLRRLRHVVLPLLTPVIFYQLIVTVIFSLQLLVEPLLLAPGAGSTDAARAVPNDNRVLMVYVYQQMFENQRFGFAAALLWLLFLLAAALTAAIFLTRRLWVHSESGNL